MSYYNLSVESMVGVSTGWVDGSEDRPIIEDQPMLAPLLPELQKAHDNLISIQVKNSVNTEELKRLGERARVLDDTHDRKLRGIYNALTTYAELADDPAAGNAYLEIQDTLFSDGLRAVQRSYLAEAGNVVMVEGRLTSSLREQLAALPVPQGNLLKETNCWIAAGKELGDVERKRAQLSQARDEEAVSLKDVNKARGRWVSVVETIMHIINVIPNLNENVRNRIVQPLYTAVEKAGQARKSKSKTQSEKAPDTAEATAADNTTETTAIEGGTTETP